MYVVSYVFSFSRLDLWMWLSWWLENLSKILQAVSVVSDVNFADNVDLSSNREDTEMIQIKHAKSYHLSFVLCNANTQAINGWDFDKAFSQYFSSMIRKLSLISKFEVDSQVVHFTEVEKKPIFDAKEKHYYFTKQVLLPFGLYLSLDFALFSTIKFLELGLCCWYQTYFTFCSLHP